MCKTLNNNTFISTRPADQNGELKTLVEAQGGKLLEMPTIQIEPTQLDANDKTLLRNIEQFTWLVFTSPNGIRFFFEELKKETGNYSIPKSIKTAVVGNKTKQVLAEFGYSTTLLNPGTTGDVLAAEMLKQVNNTDHILFPEGDLARATIATKLAAITKCTRMVVYKNIMPATINKEILQQIIDDKYHSIILTSPSSFINLLKALNNRLSVEKLRLVCIGTTTASEVEKYGINPISTASMTSPQGIVDAVMKYVNSNE